MFVWARIRSWHIVPASGGAKALCGRHLADGPRPDQIPENVPTCETCLRIAHEREDLAA